MIVTTEQESSLPDVDVDPRDEEHPIDWRATLEVEGKLGGAGAETGTELTTLACEVHCGSFTGDLVDGTASLYGNGPGRPALRAAVTRATGTLAILR